MDNLATLKVKETFQRLLQIDPDDNTTIIDGTGSVFLIATSSIRNWDTKIATQIESYGYITDSGVVFTNRSNTGSINLSGSITVNGNINVTSGSVTSATLNKDGYLTLKGFTGNVNSLPTGSLMYSGSEFFVIQ